MSIIGISSGKPAIEVERESVSANLPSTMMPISALVPPMSKVISLRRPAQFADPGAAEHAGGKARKQGQGRLLRHHRRRRDAAVRGHDAQIASQPRLLQRRVEMGDVAAHFRADEGGRARRW